MPRQRRAWLILARAPGLGAGHAWRLLERYGDAAAVLGAGRAAWREAGLAEATCQALAAPDEAALDRDEAWLAQPGNHLLTCRDPAYPDALRDFAHPSPWLFATGDTDLLAAPGFAIVGSRNPSRAGVEHARDFAGRLAETGLAVISGMAAGIDAAAHEGALAADGMTIAVCGTGLDRVYPAGNRDLARRIADRGLLLSQFPLGTPPRRGNFPRRNGVIAELAIGVLVVEAARASGSLITARLARDIGREVFALPGSVDNPLARGCHQLIRDGAKLVESAADILEEIAPQLDLDPARAQTAAPADKKQHPQIALDADYQRLLDCLGHAPATVDQLVERSGLTADAVSSMLLILELQGLITTTPGGAFRRTAAS